MTETYLTMIFGNGDVEGFLFDSEEEAYDWLDGFQWENPLEFERCNWIIGRKLNIPYYRP